MKQTLGAKRPLNSSKNMKLIKAAYAPNVRANPEKHADW